LKHEKIEIKKNITIALGKYIDKSTCMEDFSADEITDALKLVKMAILLEFIKHLGPRNKIIIFFILYYQNYSPPPIKKTNNLPKLWRKAKVVGIF